VPDRNPRGKENRWPDAQQEVKLTEQLIASMVQPFQPAQYHDEFQDQLRKLVEAKRRGQTVEVEESVKRAPVIDMMQALKESLASRTAAGAPAGKTQGTGPSKESQLSLLRLAREMGVQGRKKVRKRRNRWKVTSRRVRRSLKGESLLPPNENLQKFPDETYGNMELPFSRRKSDADSDR